MDIFFLQEDMLIKRCIILISSAKNNRMVIFFDLFSFERFNNASEGIFIQTTRKFNDTFGEFCGDDYSDKTEQSLCFVFLVMYIHTHIDLQVLTFWRLFSS